jgi:hypothetical protein
MVHGNLLPKPFGEIDCFNLDRINHKFGIGALK